MCIHLFVPDEAGTFVEPSVPHPVLDEEGNQVKGKAVAVPTRGRLACDPRRGVSPRTRGLVTTVTSRTGDARGVTCYKCKASRVYEEMMARYGAVNRGK